MKDKTNNIIIDSSRLVEQLSRFISFINYKDGHSTCISFRDNTGFLGREEDYKSHIAEKARNVLMCNKWKESWVGRGKIEDCAKKAIAKAGNLVNMNQQIDFKNRLDPKSDLYRQDAERVLYDIYRNNFCSDSLSFKSAVATFGAKYDTIAFLFFLKDDSRFLPVSPGHFDAGFKILNIDYSTSHRCSWENYQGFIDIMKQIHSVMENMLPVDGPLRLIDAHTFVWVIQEELFKNWTPDAVQNGQIEETAERFIHNVVSGTGGYKKTISNVFIRSAEVVKETKKRANGICQYCKQPAPFIDKKGEPYLEAHHVIWLSRGGEDSTDNTVALCPNCHKRMHILDMQEDVEKLQRLIVT